LIRQQATQKRLSMAQIATTIIGAQEVLEVLPHRRRQGMSVDDGATTTMRLK